MARRVILASIALAGLTAACISPIEDYHGYTADEVLPQNIKVGEDSRASVLAQLGSASTESVFDENTWFYITTQRERIAFLTPRTKARAITAIRFGEDDIVEELLTYDEEDGEAQPAREPHADAQERRRRPRRPERLHESGADEHREETPNHGQERLARAAYGLGAGVAPGHEEPAPQLDAHGP